MRRGNSKIVTGFIEGKGDAHSDMQLTTIEFVETYSDCMFVQ